MSFVDITWAMTQELPATEKMVLITLADFKNSTTGICNPGKKTIARKAGLSVRSVDDCLLRLQRRGLISYKPSRGWKSNQYTIQTPQEMQGTTPHILQGIDPENPAIGAEYPANGAEYPANGAEYPAGAAPKPVLSSNEPEKIGAPPHAHGGKPPDCPHQEIIEIFHETLPSLARVKVWNEQRQRLLRKRWTEKTERQSLDWWKRFFEYVGESAFLTGKANGSPDKPPFEATLEWIIKPTNFAKVIEGNYHR